MGIFNPLFYDFSFLLKSYISRKALKFNKDKQSISRKLQLYMYICKKKFRYVLPENFLSKGQKG